MNIDITKYQKNKDIELSNDDINIDKMIKDIRKGYVLGEEADNARNEAIRESTSKYTELETKYNNLEKSYNDVQAKMVEKTNTINDLNLKIGMNDLGFDKSKFDKVSSLRKSVYAEEQDDLKALEKIKEDFGASLIEVKEQPKQEIPEETSFNTTPKTETQIKITRKTKISDLLKR